MGGRVYVKGFDKVIKGMQGLSPANSLQLRQSLNLAAQVTENEVKKMAALEDHSLADLRAMGHPYATHAVIGSGIGLRGKKMDSGPHPDEFVHKQSSNLYDNIETKVAVTEKTAMFAVGVSKEKVPYIGYLINGTSKMRPRDFLGHAWLHIREKAIAIVKNGITVGRKSRSKG